MATSLFLPRLYILLNVTHIALKFKGSALDTITYKNIKNSIKLLLPT